MTAIEIRPAILSTYPGAITESADGVTVGRVVIPENPIGLWTPDATFVGFFNALNGKSEKAAELRRNIVFSLNNNSPCRREPTGHERALSAYFTYNPNDETVILEWGMIDSRGNAKLHTFLNQVIDYHDRAAQGMQLASGHLARVTKAEIYLAYLDRLSATNQFGPNEPMARMINTLHGHGFIPLTSEGFVQIPFF